MNKMYEGMKVMDEMVDVYKRQILNRLMKTVLLLWVLI